MKLKDRINDYETQKTQDYLLPRIPIIARIDFRGFSKFTKSLKKGDLPYDERLTRLMIDTAKYVCDKNNALIAFQQSDEITLVFKYDTVESTPFGGRYFKLCSLFAAQAAGFFNKNLSKYIPEKIDYIAECDCRVFNVPSDVEAYNALLLREQDCTRNAISMAGERYYSSSQLKYKNGNQVQEMLFQKGVNFNNYPNFFKRGTYITKQKVELEYTDEQISKMKVKPTSKYYYRYKTDVIELEQISQIKTSMLVLMFGIPDGWNDGSTNPTMKDVGAGYISELVCVVTADGNEYLARLEGSTLDNLFWYEYDSDNGDQIDDVIMWKSFKRRK